MPDFDPRAYEEQVLKPLRRRMPHLPDDLATRYAVDPSMDDGALRQRVDSVLRLWNKQAMRAGPIGLVSAQLIREHEQLLHAGKDPSTANFWQEWNAERGRRVGGAIDDVVNNLVGSHGGVGVITRNQLRVAAAAHESLGDAELEHARAKAGLEVVEPVELPATAGMRGRIETFDNKLLAAGVDSVPQLLFPELTSFGLLGGLSVTPAPAGRRAALDRQRVAERGIELEKLPDSPTVRAEKEAVGILASEAKDGTDLAGLALFHLLREARARRADGAPPRVLHALLTRRRLTSADAGRLAVSVYAENGATARDPLAVVTDLLAEGKVIAAEQAAAGLAGADGDTAREAVGRQRAQVEDLRRLAADDLRAAREEQAGSRLREALRLAADLPGLAEQLATVPATPVLGVTAIADGGGVRVAWRPAADHGGDTTYRVVRKEDRDPVDPDDGRSVPVPDGHTATDPSPPVGRGVHYAVFARTSGLWSRPSSAAVRVIPPVTDVRIEGGAGFVTGRWTTHPDAVAVEVRRTAGTTEGRGDPVVVERDRSFRDESVSDDTAYFYSVVACYPPVGGGVPLRSAPVVVRGATRPEAKPVTTLTAAPAAGDAPAVRLSWRQRTGSEVVIRRASTPCPWEYGAIVPLAELATWGSALDGQITAKGQSTSLVAPVPPGRSYCVAFTVGPVGAVRGQDAVVDVTDPVRRLRAQRFGDDVKVTWLWPDEVSAAEVQWAGGRRRITLQQYRTDGGCHLVGVPAVRRVEVGAVVLGPGDESRSPAVSVEVEERPPQLTYQLRRRGHRLAGGVRCSVTLSGTEAVPAATVILVGSAGPVMPLAPDTGIELLRAPIVVRPGVPLELPEVVVPSVLRKPYWLRCFLAEPAPAVLVDPPVSQLKVS